MQKNFLEKALGEQKAQDVITKLTASLQVRPFEFIRKTDPSQVLNFIQDEHPQTIAMILSYLSPTQSAMIFGCIDTGKTGGCCKENRNDGSYISGCYQRGGACVRTKAVILIKSGLHNRRWRRCDRRYFEYGRPWNRKTYHGISRNRSSLNLLMEIRKKMFVFEDILCWMTVQSSVCCVTLITMTLVSQQNVIFKNLSKRLSAMMFKHEECLQETPKQISMS